MGRVSSPPWRAIQLRISDGYIWCSSSVPTELITLCPLLLSIQVAWNPRIAVPLRLVPMDTAYLDAGCKERPFVESMPNGRQAPTLE
jgi:hypothetical protein